ncbi:ClpP/crotonase-like domain-containing protein [Aspergillus granulosus]|uniref:ClpP/crotonase-like domain-containing protein n=1 Tax=Aspergillus granulosus TaxID=176169 RepID=A0ABR4GW57_9EURO
MASHTVHLKYPEFRNWLGSLGAMVEHHPPLDETTRCNIIENNLDALQKFYYDTTLSTYLANKMRAHVASGVYDNITLDKHFRCIFGISPNEPTKEEQVERLEKLDYGFGDVKIVNGNVALVEIALFAPISWEGVYDRVQQAMEKISTADSLILDLRRCRGGDPNTVALVASYLIEYNDQPWLKMICPSDGITEEIRADLLLKHALHSYTKPICVLTSTSTISGGEDLAYGLQARKRATIIGEKTAGAANLPRACVLPDDFVLWVPHKYPVCPVTGGNWEGVGVEPDVTKQVLS